MSNTSSGKATKGSKLAMQQLASQKNCHLVEKFLGEKNLRWISPIKSDSYREYQLNNQHILETLGIKHLKDQFLKGFWPSRQPQWDGIAMGARGTLYLFEAKSHFSEIRAGRKGKDLTNDTMKCDSIMQISASFGIEDNPENRKHWCRDYYQISNRMTFQQRLLKLCHSHKEANYSDVKMIFLNFINDRTWKEEGKMVKLGQKWDNHYDSTLEKMGINRKRLAEKGIGIMNFDLDHVQ